MTSLAEPPATTMPAITSIVILSLPEAPSTVLSLNSGAAGGGRVEPRSTCLEHRSGLLDQGPALADLAGQARFHAQIAQLGCPLELGRAILDLAGKPAHGGDRLAELLGLL